MASTKPPNILVYSEVTSVKQNLIGQLHSTLEKDCYTVYPVTKAQVEANAWPDSTVLLVVHGGVEPVLAKVFMEYFLKGGRLLSLCSGLIESIVPFCGEVQGTKQVTLSYETWKDVRVRQEVRSLDRSEGHFVEHLYDLHGKQHEVDVRVLAVEESFRSPSILIAESNGKAVLTQIDLTDSEADEDLKKDLLKHFLGSLLDLKTRKSQDTDTLEYTSAFLLGTEQDKVKLLNSLDIPNQLTANNLKLQFQPMPDLTSTPSATLLPVLTATLPDNFNHSEYQHHLATTHLGRPLIYAPVITTSMAIVNHCSTLPHGFAVIPRRQTNGNGRTANQWLSPEGCAMFSMQLHVPLDSPLGQRLPMVQHLIAIGVVTAIRNLHPDLDIGLKWPNDIYAGGRTKIGGVIVNSQLQSAQATVNVGCAVNLSNSRPTTCVNDLIRELDPELPRLGLEQMLALVFNEIERIFGEVQRGDSEMLYELYYKYWLHGGKRVTMKSEEGCVDVSGKIVGIDEYGYLLVEPDGAGKPICVMPDGNSFDMMKGLIIPKYC